MLEKAQAIAEEVIRLRREIHKNPELGFQEFQTAALVADTLREIGIEAKTGIGRTGVVGQLGSGTGPTIAIRADMDALPILEKTHTPYASQNKGVMHACGHDAHTAILLGVAHLLKQSFLEDHWQGNVRFLFQPSEEVADENGISGGIAMVDDGALDGVDAVIALHVASDRTSGEVYFQDGYSLAAVDSFEAWVRGDGGHGAYPYAGSDPLYMLAPILTSLYAIPSRRIDPIKPSVVSLGQIHGGTTSNVIPREVYLHGTLRSYDPAVREQIIEEVERSLKLSQIMGGSYEYKVHRSYPAMFNNSQVNDWMRSIATKMTGEAKVIDARFGMGAEDFAYMTQKARGAMFMLGAAIPDSIDRHHHTDIFDIHEQVLPLGAAILAETARQFVTGKIS
jgi:amidohydrolase